MQTSPNITRPTNVKCKTLSDSSILVSWSASSSGGVAYNLFRNGSQILTNLTATSYTDDMLEGGAEYTYQVQAVSTWPGSTKTAMGPYAKGYTTVARPTNMKAVAIDAYTIVVTWTPSTTGNVVNYGVGIQTPAGVPLYSNYVTGSSYTFANLQPHTTYKFQMFASTGTRNSGAVNTTGTTQHAQSSRAAR